MNGYVQIGVDMDTDEKQGSYRELLAEMRRMMEALPEPGEAEFDHDDLTTLDYAMHRIKAAWTRMRKAHDFTATGRKRHPVRPERVRQLADQGVPVARIAQKYRMSRTTVYKLLKEASGPDVSG